MLVKDLFLSQHWIISAIFIFLLIISVSTWCIIFSKISYFRSQERILINFDWAKLKSDQSDLDRLFNQCLTVIENKKNLSQEGVARTLNILCEDYKEKIIFGHNFLASIANLSPFIGLFGTVLGVYFALIEISSQGSVNISVVSKPIGEALIATAIGLWCAIPASFSYNYFTKKSNLLTKKIKILIEEKIIR